MNRNICEKIINECTSNTLNRNTFLERYFENDPNYFKLKQNSQSTRYLHYQPIKRAYCQASAEIYRCFNKDIFVDIGGDIDISKAKDFIVKGKFWKLRKNDTNSLNNNIPLNEDKSNNLIVDIDLNLNIQKLNTIHLPKPFIILAGISGTGKTKIIRDLAGIDNNSNINNYHLEPVRPDWHEPSDLLGYISRIGVEPEFITTGFLQFIIDAWKHIFDCLNQNLLNSKDPNDSKSLILPSNLKNFQEQDPSILDNIETYWLCLDEMNLAPVELYLSDYLSILETRNWKYEYDNKTRKPKKFSYSCDPIVKGQVFKVLSNNAKESLKKEWCGTSKVNIQKQNPVDDFTEDNNRKVNNVINKSTSRYEPLFEDFLENGISLPFNLVVVGTVNMDETTHGFSRKVLDRALSFDFTEFFPNNFDDYWIEFPMVSNEEQDDIEENKISDSSTTNASLQDCIENNSPGLKLNLSYSNHSNGVDFGSSLIYKNNLLAIPPLSGTTNDSTKSSKSESSKCEKFIIDFLRNINDYALKDTPFELGFRALNELFLYILSFGKILEILEENFENYVDNSNNQNHPKINSNNSLSLENFAKNTTNESNVSDLSNSTNLNDNTKNYKEIISKTILLSILDDFVLAKILPRIEGDIDKLGSVANGKICERKNEKGAELLGSMEIINSTYSSNNNEKSYEKFDFNVKNNDPFELSVLHDLALVLIYEFELIFDKNIYLDKLNSNDPKQFINDLSKANNNFVRYDLFKLLTDFDSFNEIIEAQIDTFVGNNVDTNNNDTQKELNQDILTRELTKEEIYSYIKNNFNNFTLPTRSLKKICWMLEKLEKTSYTGFWR